MGERKYVPNRRAYYRDSILSDLTFRGRMSDPVAAAFWAGIVCWAWQRIKP